MPVFIVTEKTQFKEIDAEVVIDSGSSSKISVRRNHARGLFSKDKSICKYFIRASIQKYIENGKTEEEYYRDVLSVATRKNVNTIVFRLTNVVSTAEARRIYELVETVAPEDMRVFLMVKTAGINENQYNTIQSVLEEKYKPEIRYSIKIDPDELRKRIEEAKPIVNNAKKLSLSDFIKKTEISFSEHLFKIIDEKEWMR